METLIGTFIIMCLAFLGFGIGVLFFGKTASHDACGKVPEIDPEECLSQKAGLCPFEDDSGGLKMQRKARINYPTSS